MTASIIAGRRDGAQRLGYRDPGSGCPIVVTTPSADPKLWRDYLAGAQRSYRAFGVESVLDLEHVRDGRSTSLLFVALDADGEVIGGVRSQGPYTSVDQSHAVVEWEGSPGQTELRAMIEQWLDDGIVEIKAAWVAADRPDRRELFACLSRTPTHAATLLGARYVMGTAAAHSLAGWLSTGGVIATEVPPVAYPDERYSTQLAWLDRCAPSASFAGSQKRALEEEAAQLLAPVLPAQAARR